MSRFDDLEAQYLALDEVCPLCRRPSGEMCVSAITGRSMRATHWQRVRAATDRAAEQEAAGVLPESRSPDLNSGPEGTSAGDVADGTQGEFETTTQV